MKWKHAQILRELFQKRQPMDDGRNRPFRDFASKSSINTNAEKLNLPSWDHHRKHTLHQCKRGGYARATRLSSMGCRWWNDERQCAMASVAVVGMSFWNSEMVWRVHLLRLYLAHDTPRVGVLFWSWECNTPYYFGWYSILFIPRDKRGKARGHIVPNSQLSKIGFRHTVRKRLSWAKAP